MAGWTNCLIYRPRALMQSFICSCDVSSLIVRLRCPGLTDNQKRWLVIGIALNKILVPQIRPFVEQEVDKEYNNLKTSHNIHTQSTSGRLQRWPARKFLKYETINGNSRHPKLPGGKYNFSLFDCRVYLTLTLPSCMLKTSWPSSMLLMTTVMLQLYSHCLVVCLCFQLPCKLQLVMSGMSEMTGRTVSSVSGILLSFSRVFLTWNTWWESWLYLLQIKQNSLEN